MVEKRLFVGNLPLGIGKKDVKKKFSNYGNVLDVEVKHRKDETDNIISTFAFVNISADVADLSNCVNEMSHQDWNGHIIKVEYAKESILSRLEKERTQKQDGEQPSTSNNLKRKNDSYSGTEYKLPHVSSSYNSMFSAEKPENINGYAKYNGRLKMFGGTERSHAQKHIARKEDLKPKHCNGDILKRFEAYSDVWKDSSESYGNTVNNRSNCYEDKDYFHNRSHLKSPNYGFEISKNEIKDTGIVKPYISSDSDSEGGNKTSNMKLSYKGAKKFKKDTVNDNSNASMHGIGNKHYNGDILNRFDAYNNVWKDSNKFLGNNTINNRNFHSNGGESDDDEGYNHNRTRPNYGFEISENEIKNTGIVKPYISSDSDSEGVNETRSMKLTYKGKKKFKIDTVNYNSSANMSRIDDKSMPLKKEGIWSSGNCKVRETKQNINGHIENNAVVTDADQSVSTESKHLNPMSQLSEEKRQKSVLEKMKARNKEKNLIKQALLEVDSKKRLNKKIVFSDEDDGSGGGDDDGGGRSYENKNFAGKKTSVSATSKKINMEKTLFDDGSDSDINEELSKLKINQQFEGAKGQKLLELQSRYAHDDRFVLDSRFYESDNEDSDQEDNKNKSSVTENAAEKDDVQKQLEILEDVLGYQITKAPADKKKQIQEDTTLLRFDPTRSEHSKYVITPSTAPSTSTSGETKTKRQKPAVMADVPKRPVEVSKEKFYEIDDSLKEILKHSSKKNSRFSMLELFGSKPNEDENENDKAHYTTEESTNKNSKAHYTTESTDLPFKPKHQPRNPFKYDSSESDEEEEQQVMQDNKQSAENNKPFFGLWTETFFLQDRDSRLKEAKEFFMNSNSDDEKEVDFKNKRKYLKKIVRWKSKNSAKNDKLFKTKLGGQSTKVKRKNVRWKVRKFQKKR